MTAPFSLDYLFFSSYRYSYAHAYDFSFLFPHLHHIRHIRMRPGGERKQPMSFHFVQSQGSEFGGYYCSWSSEKGFGVWF